MAAKKVARRKVRERSTRRRPAAKSSKRKKPATGTAARKQATRKRVTRKRAARRKATRKSATRDRATAPSATSIPRGESTAAELPPDASFRLRTPAFDHVVRCPAHLLQNVAMRWSYTVHNRMRWARTEAAVDDLRSRASADLETLGVEDGVLSDIAEHGTCEVGTTYAEEETGWEARILPWEYVISASTKAHRGDRRLTVVRHLERPGPTPIGKPQKALVIESAPGALGKLCTFEHERDVVALNLEIEPDVLRNPTRTELAGWIRTGLPDVVHFSGVDAHQGAELLGLEDAAAQTYDGLYLLRNDEREESVDAQTFAAIVNAAPRAASRPSLFACNAYHSAGRTCALAVAGGCGASIGFQDRIDDDLAELFFATFYQAWRLTRYDLLSAFRIAWRELRRQPRTLRGSGIVLWSARSLVDAIPTASVRPSSRRRSAAASRRSGAAAPGGAATPSREEQVRETIELQRRQPIRLQGDEAIHELLSVEVTPKQRLNYALLHNDQGLFDEFTLRKRAHGLLRDVHVEVVLYVGSDSFPYRATFNVDRSPLAIHDLIRVPLTWEFVRGLKESVRTSVYYRVRHAGTVVREDTGSVTLVPVEEWEFGRKEDEMWLPSFVLPRDAAVVAIVDRAKRYLRALADDVGAGFAGYQVVDPDLEDPCVGVDQQVRAIWSALINDFDITYINPPPSYADATQRLRSPSEVVDTASGTCVDLALLLASCLEYVEIYPVVFLLEDHAFPGYWRNVDDHGDFVEADHLFEDVDAMRRSGDGAGQESRWTVGRRGFRELRAFVDSRRLVPLEAVCLTTKEGFAAASAKGDGNLSSQRRFDGMVDVALARWADVTPLPL